MNLYKSFIQTKLLIIISLFVFTSFKSLDLKQVVDGSFSGESWNITSMPDGEYFLRITPDGRRILKYSFKTGEIVDTMFDLASIRGVDFDHIDGVIVDPTGRRLLIQTRTKPIYRHSFTANFYLFDIGSNKVEPLSENGSQQVPLFSPDGNMVAFVRDNNIFLVKLLYDGAESQVTTDGVLGEIINGIPDWVNEEEFVNDRCVVFSSDSRQLCWIRYDERRVKEYSLPSYTPAFNDYGEVRVSPSFSHYKYPLAGEQNSIPSVCSYDIKSKKIRTLDLPLDSDGYIPRIFMTGDASKIAVVTLNRRQDVLRIYMCDPLSTLCELCIEDKADKYICEKDITSICVTDENVILTSDRSGFRRIYVYSLNGNFIRSIPSNDDAYEVTCLFGMDSSGSVYYAANAFDVSDCQIYVSDKKGKVACLSSEKGYNSAIFASNFKYYLNTWSNISTPPICSIRSNNGKLLSTLYDNADLKSRTQYYGFAKPELFSFSTNEGVELHGWILKPIDFDASKGPYPLLMYQYGGPGSQSVLDYWGIGMLGSGGIFEQYLCQHGYIVMCVDNRGTGGRGAEFEKCTYLSLGEKEAYDQVEAALWASHLDYVDGNRIGIYGWSYGGRNVLMSMSCDSTQISTSTSHDTNTYFKGFKAGVAISPTTDWRFYDTVYTERYMRLPKENFSGYSLSPLSCAMNLSGSLLLCHGLCDDNVHPENTLCYISSLIKADKPYSLLLYPNCNHSINFGNSRVHLIRQIVSFFDDHLL